MRVTSPDLQTLDISATKVWQKLVKTPGRFVIEYAENIFGIFDVGVFPELKEWWKYIVTRYNWVMS
jgi:hypothetical protein